MKKGTLNQINWERKEWILYPGPKSTRWVLGQDSLPICLCCNSRLHLRTTCAQHCSAKKGEVSKLHQSYEMPNSSNATIISHALFLIIFAVSWPNGVLPKEKEEDYNRLIKRMIPWNYFNFIPRPTWKDYTYPRKFTAPYVQSKVRQMKETALHSSPFHHTACSTRSWPRA